VAGREFLLVTGIVEYRAGLHGRLDLLVGECGDDRVGVTHGAPLLVQGRVVGEVGRWCGRLTLGDDLQEVRLAHWLAGVVDRALFADGRRTFGGQALAARRPGAVGREHPHGVPQAHQLV
jgi:hypothetical protein